MSAGLSGTGRLADDLYLMAHHEVTGKPFVQPRALGTGLAGGLLAELMLGASISLRPDGAVLPKGPGCCSAWAAAAACPRQLNCCS